MEEQIKRRVAIGSFVSERKLVDELVRWAPRRGWLGGERCSWGWKGRCLVEGDVWSQSETSRLHDVLAWRPGASFSDPTHAHTHTLPRYLAGSDSTRTWCARGSCSCRPPATLSTGASGASSTA